MRFIDLAGTIEELRQAAEDECVEAGLLPLMHKQDTLAWNAADLIEHLRDALKRIADGASPAAGIASKALRELQDD